jgi:hypothetical protein
MCSLRQIVHIYPNTAITVVFTFHCDPDLKHPLENGPPLTPAASRESLQKNISAECQRPVDGDSETSSVQLPSIISSLPSLSSNNSGNCEYKTNFFFFFFFFFF